MDSTNTNQSLPVDASLQKINEEIYKRNLELAIANKTLALLQKLYHASLVSFDLPKFSEQTSEIIRIELNMELVGIFTFDASEDSLLPYKFSKSDRMKTEIDRLGFLFSDSKIERISNKPILKEVTHGKSFQIAEKMSDIWGDNIDVSKLEEITKKTHLKSMLLYPLLVQNQIIGVLFLGLNRAYETLSKQEVDSMNSTIDVVAVGLDKVLLYKNLEIANEHLRVLDKQKSDFVSIASHQLRSPVTAITGYSSMLIEGTYGTLPLNVIEVLGKVYQSSRNLAVIIDDFLTISHIEQGKMTYKFETVEMKKIIEALIDEFLPVANDKGLFIHFTTDGYDEYNITGDFGKIRQVLSNLVDNAIKYTISGGIEIRITKDFALRKTRIMVKDTGIGLSKESISALFQKFSRAKEVQKVYTDGSGIGLYIGQELVKAHHGRIWVESEGEGKGASFFVELLSEE